MKQVVNRLKSIIARGIIQMVNDEQGRQFCQVSVLAGETKNNVERIQHFGFTSNPPSGSAAAIAFVGADRGKPMIFGDNHPASRKTGLVPGESAAYDNFDQYIYLKKDGSIEVKTGGTLLIKSADKVRVEADILECTGEIKDRCDDDGVSMSEGREIFDTHDHDENDSGGPTEKPNQLMGGFNAIAS